VSANSRFPPGAEFSAGAVISAVALRFDESQADDPDADMKGMQFCTTAARGESDLGAIRSLHLSLNAPVIAIDELPVGPARAGVVLRELSDGGSHLQIVIRSLRTGEVVAVASDLDPEGLPEEVAAVEAALSYAEGMGFLFDEDEVASGDADAAEKAGALWCDLVEEVPERARAHASAASSRSLAATEADASVRDVPIQQSVSDVETIAIDLPAEIFAAGSPASLLTKFRLALDGSDPGCGTAVIGSPRESRIRLLSRY
jgi:hypothetical protein